MNSSREPDYSLGRFFISPILGCRARCSFCYIFSNGYNSRLRVNSFGIQNTIDLIVNHPEYKQGKDGSILSIGAWGDPFPPKNIPLCNTTIQWLKALCQTGNPIQLMSRFTLTDELIEQISNSILYENQLLYSTSISTISNWESLELNSSPPLERLDTLVKLRKLGVPVNVMIKPFIFGVTDTEIMTIGKEILARKIEYCVVGTLHWDDDIVNYMSRKNKELYKIIEPSIDNEPRKQLFDCTSNKYLLTSNSNILDESVRLLSKLGLRVFKKSSCVNSHILNSKNISLFHENDPNGFCVNCGICD